MGKHKLHKYDGLELTSRDCAEYLGLTLRGFHSRLKRFKGNIKKTMEHPFRGNMIRKEQTFLYKGQQLTVTELSIIRGLTRIGMYRRLQRHKYNIPKAMAKARYEQ